MASVETSTPEAEIDIIEQQQYFYDLFGHESALLYDCYTSKESLAQKMNLILPQKNEIERNELTTLIWNQNVYNGGKCLYMSPIYITLVLDHKPQNEPKILSKSFQVHPVFRVLKCMTKSQEEGEDGGNCCAVFIDESGRVYMNWTVFRTDNIYDDGLVVAPMRGIYNAWPEDKVKLEFFERKAGITKSRRSMRIADDNTFDIATSIGAGIGGPVGAGIVGLSVLGIQGISNLFDGKKKTIKYTHPEVRSSWLNLAAEAFSAAGATELLAKADDNSAATTNIIPPAGALGLLSSGCLADIYLIISKLYESENLSTLEIYLSELLYLLTHSAKNQRTAEEISSLSQARKLIDLMKILRDSQKMAINGLVHKTMIIHGLDSPKIGQVTIRSLKNHIDLHMLTELYGEGHEKRNKRKDSIKKKFLEMFESCITSMFSQVFARFKKRNENEHISNDEKIAIVIDGEVERVICQFQALNIVYMVEDLRETVRDVLLSLPLAASNIFFDIVTKFTTKNAKQIQTRLARFIPIDIFMTDIYSLLIKLSISRGQELEQYLLDYNESVFEEIEKQIRQFYDNQFVSGDSYKCSHCAGSFFK